MQTNVNESHVLNTAQEWGDVATVNHCLLTGVKVGRPGLQGHAVS